MKRNIFKALTVLTALVFASCTMGNTIEKQNDNTDGKTAYITIGLNEIARTALPGVENEDDFDSFKLTYNRIPPAGSTVITIPNTLGQWTGDESKSAYKKMTAEKFAVTSGKSYKFTLTATKGGATWQGEITKAIETGENSLSFKLSLTSLTTEGEGSLCITLSVPDAVKSVDAELKTMDESQTISPADAAVNFADGKATYTASGIAAGNYVLVYSLYGENKSSLGQWREYAGIADGLTSSSNPVIASNDSLAKLYKITLNLNGGTFNGFLPGSYTRYDCVGLPYYALWMYNDGYFYDCSVTLGKQEIYRKNYLFEGWYDAETGGNLVESIPFDSTGDITLWAHWTDTLTVPVDKILKEKSFDDFKKYLANTFFSLKMSNFDHINLKLTNMADGITPHSNGYDDWTDERFTAIVEAISSVRDFSVNLDLSETSLTFIPCSAFFDNFKLKNLTGITLPKTLTEIIQNAFANTSFTKITIPANVEEIGRFAFEASALEEITFEKPTSEIDSGLQSIGQNAFYGSKITSITLPASLMHIHDSAFEACDKLETINYEGTAEMWAQLYRDDYWHEGIKATTVKCSDYTVPIDLSPADFEGLIGTKPASIAKEVGDIVFSDGSAIPYTEDLELTETQKDNAVAVIFYKGTGLNSGKNYSTIRTLGVGFYTDSRCWCSEDANAYDLCINTIQCNPDTSNAQYDKLLFFDETENDRNGSDNLEQIGKFLAANGQENDTDDSSKYPAFYFAKYYDAPGNKYDDGWYLPSLAEFFELYNTRLIDPDGDDINAALRLVTDIEWTFHFDDSFLTSTQASYDDFDDFYDDPEYYYKKSAYLFYHYDDGIWPGKEDKTFEFNVCAIREF